VASYGAAQQLAYTRYSLTSNCFCTNKSSFHSAGPPALPTLLQFYCTTVGQYTTPPHPPFSMCHTPYNIGNNNVLWRPTQQALVENGALQGDESITKYNKREKNRLDQIHIYIYIYIYIWKLIIQSRLARPAFLRRSRHLSRTERFKVMNLYLKCTLDNHKPEG